MEWAEKDRITRASIEAQTAYNGVMGHLNAWIATGKTDTHPLAKEVEALKDAAYQWALSKLTSTPQPTPKQTTPSTGRIEALTGLPDAVKDVGEALTLAHKKGMDKDAFCIFLGITGLNEITDLQVAWQAVKSKLEGK